MVKMGPYAGEGGEFGGARIRSDPNFTRGQMDLFNRMERSFGPGLEQGMQRRARLAGGDPSAFEEIEAPAKRFMSEFMGNQASRFSGLGTGARRSSGFSLANTAAGQQLAESLASNRHQLSEEALNSLFEMAEHLLGQRPFEKYPLKPKVKGWQKGLGIGLPIAGAVAGGLFGGPPGAMMGAQAGSTLGSAFTGGGF